ncbi:efflux transporter outer membrane subunit [Hydrocarboniphaga sp.]|uniref:efflux transporter outer membrane subunit n=1 Tax=Hydrocarboniphaga sp. TaxID=2033016 RepID=UPI0026177950|nr:TolC family protein [Hydrocarboniphaga sp.]
MSPPLASPLSGSAGPKTVRAAGQLAGRVAMSALAASFALVFTGCSTPISHAQVDVPAQFVAGTVADIEPEAAWWESFGDPILTELVRRAAIENRDVKIAAERLHAARAGVTVSRSFLMPSVSAVGSAGDRSSGYGDAVKQLLPDTKSASAGLDVSWEVDLSGRLRAGAAASAADALAAEHGVRGVRLLVMTDVASNYFTLVGAQRQLDTLRAITAAHDETLRLVKARQRAGLATSFDVERAQTDAESARAQIPPLETVVAVSRHRIAVLIGDQASHAARIEPWRGDAIVPQAQPGQPATLLQRRPDVLALMAQLDAANARRKQAAAEWFPRLFLDASFGSQNLGLNGIGLGAARYTNVAGLLAMPIFNAGRTQALNEAAESGQREAVLRAEDGMVRALEDVENALVALSSERQRSQSLQAAAASAEAALGRAQSLYDRGQIDLLPLLDAQRARLAVRLSANDGSTQLLLDSVQLYKALGGGWQAFEPAADNAARPLS